MKTDIKPDENYFVVLQCADLSSLETYLKTSGLQYKIKTTHLYSEGSKERKSIDLIGNISQFYKLISDLLPHKNIRIITNNKGEIADISISGFNKDDTISILKNAQSIYISDKET